MKSKEEVLVAITSLVHQAHEAGFFISGCISIDNAMACMHCGYQMKLVLTDRERGIYARKCPRCEGAGGQHITLTPPTIPKPLPLSIQTDAPMCFKCGGMMTRRGSCYYCNDCGESSGCS